jgi:hypothetical protein
MDLFQTVKGRAYVRIVRLARDLAVHVEKPSEGGRLGIGAGFPWACRPSAPIDTSQRICYPGMCNRSHVSSRDAKSKRLIQTSPEPLARDGGRGPSYATLVARPILAIRRAGSIAGCSSSISLPSTVMTIGEISLRRRLPRRYRLGHVPRPVSLSSAAAGWVETA